MKYDVITVGSATIDVFVKTKQQARKYQSTRELSYHIGEKFLIEKLQITTGGGGTNTAVAFARLGLKTGFIGVVGTDVHGEYILKDLHREGVHFLGIKKEGMSGYSIILEAKDDRTILTYKGVNNLLEWRYVPHHVSTHWLYLSTMMEKSLLTMMRLAPFIKKQGVSIAVNMSRYESCMGLKRLSSLLTVTDILILNKEEAYALTHQKEIYHAVSMIKKIVLGIIVITDGKHTIHAFHSNKEYKKKVKPISVVDATGAGDAFAAGFVYSIMQKKNIPQALDAGCKEAQSVLQALGAKQNLLKRL